MDRLLMNRWSVVALALILWGALTNCSESDAFNSGDLSGKGGSLARFAISATHLYAVDNNALNVYRFEGDGTITKVNTVALGSGVETIATRDQWLYIGTNMAMFIYDISRPASPSFVSEYNHFVGCDPVVVQDTLAFVTLRTTGCRPASWNTLDVINIKDPKNPSVINSMGMSMPYGLGIDGKLLFVCEGVYGLNVYDVTDPYNLKLLKNYPDVNAYDVIPNHGTLVVTGSNGVFQYDYSDYNNIRHLSTINIQE